MALQVGDLRLQRLGCRPGAADLHDGWPIAAATARKRQCGQAKNQWGVSDHEVLLCLDRRCHGSEPVADEHAGEELVLVTLVVDERAVGCILKQPPVATDQASLPAGTLAEAENEVRTGILEPGRKGFQVEPRRWKIEQTFACLQRYRRLRVDDERSHDASRYMTILASVFMIGMRLERMLQP